MAARLASLVGAAALVATASVAAEDPGHDPGYEWMTGHGDGNASLVYGSPETGEDYVFNVFCRGDDKATGMTVYVDIAGTKVGDPVDITFSSGTAKLAVPGHIATDEMSGFLFAEAEGFTIKPVTGLLGGKGPISVTTGSVLTALPEAGRAKAVGEFAKFCTLE